jgi:hypothetical protein
MQIAERHSLTLAQACNPWASALGLPRSLRHERPRRPARVFAPVCSPPILGESTDSPAVVGFVPDANPRTGPARVP